MTAEWLADVVRRIKDATGLAVTLSVGERPDSDYELWRGAGADRYLLRFEASNLALYERIHPSLPAARSDRVATLRRLRAMGYEIGSGFMVGVPGQTYEDLAGDIELLGHLELDMIGIGPFVAHPATPLGGPMLVAGQQVPPTAEMALRVVALARLVCPKANIPSTTAVATTGGAAGQAAGLQRGANVVMPNLTPARYRRGYEIYPAKAGVVQDRAYHRRIAELIESLGRVVGVGAGRSPAYAERMAGRQGVA